MFERIFSFGGSFIATAWSLALTAVHTHMLLGGVWESAAPTVYNLGSTACVWA
jgi:hypothetical protein